MKDLTKLSEAQLMGELRSLGYIQAGLGTIGTIGGWVYANKTGGGFWRYVGFGLLGGVAIGVIGYFTTMQKANKIVTEIDSRKASIKGGKVGADANSSRGLDIILASDAELSALYKAIVKAGWPMSSTEQVLIEKAKKARVTKAEMTGLKFIADSGKKPSEWNEVEKNSVTVITNRIKNA